MKGKARKFTVMYKRHHCDPEDMASPLGEFTDRNFAQQTLALLRGANPEATYFYYIKEENEARSP